MPNLPSRQEVHQQFDRFDRHLRLSFLGAGSQVWRAEHVGHVKERAVGARLFAEHVQRHAGQLAALQPLQQCLFVVDAAARAVDQPRCPA